MTEEARPWASVMGSWHIFRKEILEVLRDRRAVFVAFVLPLLLYPLLYLWLGAIANLRDEKRPLSIGVAGAGDDFFVHLSGLNLKVERRMLSDIEDVREGDLVVLAHFEGARVTLYHRATDLWSREALRRLRVALDAYRDVRIFHRLAEKGRNVEPSRIAAIDPVDLSSPEARASTTLGKILPFLLVIILLTGGSFAAIDVIAGEKERGTLEALFVHPVDRKLVVRGKFFVVFAASFVALGSNLIGLLLAQGLSAFLGRPVDSLGLTQAAIPGPWVAIGIFLLTGPLALLTSGILILISAYARSFREAQTYLLPVTLLTLPLLLLAVAPEATLSSAVAIVPLANAALAIRELLEGRLTVVPFLIASSTSLLYAWLVLRNAQTLLLREDLVLGVEEPPGGSSLDVRARRALFFAGGLLGVLYFAASSIQSWNLLLGLTITLWGLVLVPALIYPWIVGSPFLETLALRTPSLRSLLLGPLVAASLVVLNAAYLGLQDQFLPMPIELENIFRELLLRHQMSPPLAVFLFVVSPGICEELLWRGTFQGELEPRARPIRTALWVGFFFGLFHFSIYRLFPTAAVGFVLALVRQRAGSIFPCMLIHATYNAMLCFGLEALLERLKEAGLSGLLTHPFTAALALCVLVLSIRALRARSLPVREMAGG